MRRNGNMTIVVVVSILCLAALAAYIRIEHIIPQVYAKHITCSQVKTGDLLLFSRSFNVLGDLIKFIVGSPHTHVGIAVVHDNGVLSVAELNPRSAHKKGVCVNRILRSGQCVVRSISHPLCTEVFLKKLAAYNSTVYSYNVVYLLLTKWLSSVFIFPRSSIYSSGKMCHSKNYKQVCTEFVSSMYASMGVMVPQCECVGSYKCRRTLTPHDFLYDSNMQLAPPYSFSPPQLLRF